MTLPHSLIPPPCLPQRYHSPWNTHNRAFIMMLSTVRSPTMTTSAVLSLWCCNPPRWFYPTMSPWCLYHDAFSMTWSTDDDIYYNVIHYHGHAIHQDVVALMTLPGCNLSQRLHHTIYHAASTMTPSSWYNPSGYVQYYAVHYGDFPWCHIPRCLHQDRFTKRVHLLWGHPLWRCSACDQPSHFHLHFGFLMMSSTLKKCIMMSSTTMSSTVMPPSSLY